MHGVGVAPLPGEGEGTVVGMAPVPGRVKEQVWAWHQSQGRVKEQVWAWHHSQGRVKEQVWAWHQSQGRVEGTGVGGSPYSRHEHKHTLLLPSTLLPQPLSRERIPLLAGHSAHYNALLNSGVSSPGLTAQYISLPVPLLFLSRCMEHC